MRSQRKTLPIDLILGCELEPVIGPNQSRDALCRDRVSLPQLTRTNGRPLNDSSKAAIYLGRHEAHTAAQLRKLTAPALIARLSDFRRRALTWR